MHTEGRYYIAKLGVGTDNILKEYAVQMNILGVSLNGIEVFDTPFDAICALNDKSKLMPEHHITIYSTKNNYNSVTISGNSEPKTIITEDNIDFIKHDTIVLGGLVYSL